MFFNGSKIGTSAIARDIIETQLIEEYHWLPYDIEKIPYKFLQKLFIIKQQKNEVHNIKIQTEDFKRQHTSSRGQGKRFYREV